VAGGVGQRQTETGRKQRLQSRQEEAGKQAGRGLQVVKEVALAGRHSDTQILASRQASGKSMAGKREVLADKDGRRVKVSNQTRGEWLNQGCRSREAMDGGTQAEKKLAGGKEDTVRHSEGGCQEVCKAE
jgi:hypothetical protein